MLVTEVKSPTANRAAPGALFWPRGYRTSGAGIKTHQRPLDRYPACYPARIKRGICLKINVVSLTSCHVPGVSPVRSKHSNAVQGGLVCLFNRN